MDFNSPNRQRIAAICLLLISFAATPVIAEQKSTTLELTRTARPWEFLAAVGQRAGLFGNEAGNFEAWVYPLKIFRNFHLRFRTEGRVIPAKVARQKWDSLWKAYQFLRSTYDAQGLPQNFGIGHGWVEGGPLLPVKTELYRRGLGAEGALTDCTGTVRRLHRQAGEMKSPKPLGLSLSATINCTNPHPTHWWSCMDLRLSFNELPWCSSMKFL